MSNIKGKVIVLGDTIQVTEKFSKRELVIDTGGEYPQLISIQFAQDNCIRLDTVSVGQEVDVSYNLRGRSWTNPQGETKYFNTIEGWKIEAGVNPAPLQSAPIDDLPF